MKPIIRLPHSLLDSTGEKWVYAQHFQVPDDPKFYWVGGVPLLRVEDLPEFIIRHGLETACAGLYETIVGDWYDWFDSTSKMPEGPARRSNRESTKVVDSAMARFESIYRQRKGTEYATTVDYLYTHFMQIMGLERNVEWDDLSQWELSLLTTVQMAFAGIMLAYLDGPMEMELDEVIPVTMSKLHAVFSGVALSMSYAVDNLTENLNEFTEKY